MDDWTRNWKYFWDSIVGFTPSFEKWNIGEPNNNGDEDYAHITALGVGIPGSWNDLPDFGPISGVYQPKGYIVEYGGMPGDPLLNISASSTITIPTINPVGDYEICDSGSVTLNATENQFSGTKHKLAELQLHQEIHLQHLS